MKNVGKQCVRLSVYHFYPRGANIRRMLMQKRQKCNPRFAACFPEKCLVCCFVNAFGVERRDDCVRALRARSRVTFISSRIITRGTFACELRHPCAQAGAVMERSLHISLRKLDALGATRRRLRRKTGRLYFRLCRPRG